MYSAIFRFDVRPERREDFRALSRQYAEECVREEPGRSASISCKMRRTRIDSMFSSAMPIVTPSKPTCGARSCNGTGRRLARCLSAPPEEIGRGVEFYP